MANVAKNTKKRWVAANLEKIATGETTLSYYLLRELIEVGYLVATFTANGKGRGRPVKGYELSAKGKNLVRLAKFWPKAA